MRSYTARSDETDVSAKTKSETGLEAVPVLELEALLAVDEPVLIDLRSPAEFAQDHLVGARNVPLFDDTERALIGLFYKRLSPAAAFAEGLAVVGGRVHHLVAQIAAAAGWKVPAEDLRERVRAMTAGGIERLERELDTRVLDEPPVRPVVLHCWRGGLRSRSVVALLRGLGLDRAVALAGGYRAWRSRVREATESWIAPSAFVLRGLTGVGKTLVLRELERQRPRWTFDLEAQAGHRSSLLGMVGLEPCSQKAFESRIFARLCAGFPGPVVFEGESRKVGDVVIPAGVWRALSDGTSIELVANTERRVDVLIEDYLAHEGDRPRLRRQLAELERRMGGAELGALFDAGRERELVEILLERYYDPLYRRSERGRRYAVTIDSADPARAAREVRQWIEAR